VLNAFQSNLCSFTPTQIAANEAPKAARSRRRLVG
jgi:hypothetical protein